MSAFDSKSAFAVFTFRQLCLNLYPLQNGALELFLEEVEKKRLPEANEKNFLFKGTGKVYLVSEPQEFLIAIEDNNKCSVYINRLHRASTISAWEAEPKMLTFKEAKDQRKEINRGRMDVRKYIYLNETNDQTMVVEIGIVGKEENPANFVFTVEFGKL